MKRGKRFLYLVMVVVLGALAVLNVSSISAKAETSELVEFKSVMMESVSDQIHSASDLTTTENNRAILAALLTLEFAYQRPDYTIDYTQPIYVCKQGDLASVAFAGSDSYALVIYQSNPLSTSYGFFTGKQPSIIQATLTVTNESVWTVDIDDYNEKLVALIEQLE